MVRQCAVLCLVSATALGQVPPFLAYQGRLLKSDGAPVVGMKQITFRAFSSATGSSSLWSETHTLGLSDGYYSTLLGTESPSGCFASSGCTGVPMTLVTGNPFYLELEVDGVPLAPRQPVASVAAAFRADTAKNLKGGTVDATQISINGVTVFGSDGKLSNTAGYNGASGVEIVAATNTIQLKRCSAPGEYLRWDGSDWVCANLPPAPAQPFQFNGSVAFYNGGSVGIGTNAPTSRLSVVGVIESKDGGVRFPDGTTQVTAGLSGVVGITNGGTGATTAANARAALGVGNVGTLTLSGNAGHVLRGDGTFNVPPPPTFPVCNSLPDSATNKPCITPMYRCPNDGSANGATSGAWASYGCYGQLQLSSQCFVAVYPQTEMKNCSHVAWSPVY